MREDLVTARRNESVREAAVSWRKASLIDGTTADKIIGAFPDDRHRKSIAWRALIFFFTCVLATALLGFVMLTLKVRSDSGAGFLLLFAGALLLLATEVQSSVLLFDGVGSESATSFLGLLLLLAGARLSLIPLLHLDSRLQVVVSALILALLCTISAWRWGYPLYALAAAISLLAAVAFQFEGNRLTIVVAAGLLALPSEMLRDFPKIPLSHRTSLAAASLAGLAAIYAAINRYSLDHQLIEQMVSSSGSASELTDPGRLFRFIASVLTAMFPPVLFVLGLRTRRRLLLDAGLVSGALSLMTLRQYVHLGPTWLVLCGSGVVLTITALLAERFLKRSPEGERGGFMAEPELPSGDASRGAEIAGVLWNLAPSAAPTKPEGPLGGGGSFGGGGATGGF